MPDRYNIHVHQTQSVKTWNQKQNYWRTLTNPVLCCAGPCFDPQNWVELCRPLGFPPLKVLLVPLPWIHHLLFTHCECVKFPFMIKYASSSWCAPPAPWVQTIIWSLINSNRYKLSLVSVCCKHTGWVIETQFEMSEWCIWSLTHARPFNSNCGNFIRSHRNSNESIARKWTFRCAVVTCTKYCSDVQK